MCCSPGRPVKHGHASAFVSDFFDFSVYLDADENDLEHWYINALPAAARDRLPRSAVLLPQICRHADDEAEAMARDIWTRINLRNLHENILPTRARASLVLTKDAQPHAIQGAHGGATATNIQQSKFQIARFAQ